MAKIVTYECDQCGCEVVVTQTPETDLMPIYCCGMEVKEVSLREKKAVKTAKRVAKKTAKKGTTKKATKVKRPAAKKKAARRSSR